MGADAVLMRGEVDDAFEADETGAVTAPSSATLPSPAPLAAAVDDDPAAAVITIGALFIAP